MEQSEDFKSIKKEYICRDSAPFECCHASSIAVLPNGCLFSVWFAGSKEGVDDVNIWGSIRENGIWNQPQVIAQDKGKPHWNPVLFVKANDGVLLFYKVGRDISKWQTKITTSEDDCKSWSESKELVPGDHGGRGPVRNKVIGLSNGRWLAPASLENGEWRCFADRSDDDGVTWTKSNEIYADLQSVKSINPDFKDIPVSEQSYSGRGIIQPTLWESQPGHIHMLMRSSEGCVFRSDSEDNGENWCRGYATVLPNNNSGIDLVRIPDGRLFLVYNPVGTNWGPRTPLKLACSEDNGSTWRDTFVLENELGEFSYPAIIYSKSSLYITYTYQRKTIAFWKLELA